MTRATVVGAEIRGFLKKVGAGEDRILCLLTLRRTLVRKE